MTTLRPGRRELPLVQFDGRPGSIDLAWGHPDPVLLPVDEMRGATAAALATWGPDALAYGAAAGPGPLIELIAERLAIVDRRAPSPLETWITPGAAPGLDQAVTLLAEPGDVVLVEAPTYHYALLILGQHPVEVRPVPVDEEGLVVDALPAILAELRAAGKRPRLLYAIPTFHNPTGVSLAAHRRRDLVALAVAESVVILEDDVYRELAFDGPAPPSLWSDAPPGTVVRLGSFAKSLAPGLRVGYTTADEALAHRFVGRGYLVSSGTLSHLPALAVAAYLADGGYARNVERLRAGYRERRDALLEAFATELPRGTSWTTPGGGYFAWVTLPDRGSGSADGAPGAAVLRAAVEAAGTGYVPGTAFCAPGATGPVAAAAARSFRVSWARWSPDELREAARRLGRALRDAGLGPA